MEEYVDPPANYGYWLLVRTWTAEEAAALVLGVEPEYTRYHYEEGWSEGPEDKFRSAMAVTTDRVERIMESAQIAGEFGEVQLNQVGKPWGAAVTWRQWIEWVKKNEELFLHPDLTAAIEQFQNKSDSQSPDERIHPRRETTLLRSIAVLLHLLKNDSDRSEADVIREVADLFGHIPGIGKSTLQRDFAEAKRRLKDY